MRTLNRVTDRYKCLSTSYEKPSRFYLAISENQGIQVFQNYVEIAFGEYGQKLILVYGETLVLAGIAKIRNDILRVPTLIRGLAKPMVTSISPNVRASSS
jgi:hypothetical protein